MQIFLLKLLIIQKYQLDFLEKRLNREPTTWRTFFNKKKSVDWVPFTKILLVQKMRRFSNNSDATRHWRSISSNKFGLMSVIKVSTLNFLPVEVSGKNKFQHFSICRNPDFGKPPKSDHNIVVSRHSTSFFLTLTALLFLQMSPTTIAVWKRTTTTTKRRLIRRPHWELQKEILFSIWIFCSEPKIYPHKWRVYLITAEKLPFSAITSETLRKNQFLQISIWLRLTVFSMVCFATKTWKLSKIWELS